MSKRRMFSQSIVESDAFLDMPLGTQALYYHLGMNADDDGFVNPKRVMRMVGANDDDLKILIAKRFILAFDSGVVVVKHWPTNNFIRTDRYKATSYKAELSSLTKNENGDYTELSKINNKVTELTEGVTQRTTNGIPDDNTTGDPSKVRLGKVSIDSKESMGVTDTPRKSEKTKAIDGMFEYWQGIVGYAITARAKQNREYAGKIFADYDKQSIAEAIHAAARASEDKYAPRIANFIDLYRRWDELKLWDKREVKSSPKQGRGFKVR